MNYKILVIDDSPFIYKAVKKSLEPCGYEIVGHAENGLIGLEMYDRLNPDIITLDVTMPVMDGIETASNLFKINPDVNLIMLSAMGDEDLINAAKNLGVRYFLSKPFKSNELVDVVNSIMNN
jgi:Response regulator containing CheY-like receiver domain and AraC-type DNA-binding domain